MKILSIIIPSKNEAKFLPGLLEALVNQINVDIESVPIIIADNNSSDGTLRVIKQYQDAGLDIIVIEGGLPARARNNGARIANSEYLMFLDADNIPSPSLLSSVFKAIDKEYICITPSFHDPLYQYPYEIIFILANFFLRYRVIGSYLLGGCIVIKKEKFDKIGGFDENLNFGEDIDLAKRLSRDEIRLIDNVVYYNSRRFKRDGFFKTFGGYIVNYFKITFGLNKKNDSKDYFDNDFR
jgi:glycosyltransferase involved in cell wall biosynthesis